LLALRGLDVSLDLLRQESKQRQSAWKNFNAHMNAAIFYAVLKSATRPRALRGKEGWEFSGLSPKDAFLSSAQREKWKLELDEREAQAKRLNLDIAFMLVPRADSIYFEKLPLYAQAMRLDKRWQEWKANFDQAAYVRLHYVDIRSE